MGLLETMGVDKANYGLPQLYLIVSQVRTILTQLVKLHNYIGNKAERLANF